MAKDFRSLFSSNIGMSLRRALSVVSDARPSFMALTRIAAHQPGAQRKRSQSLKKGVSVPQLLILSATHACNLRCTGCYHRALHTSGANTGKPLSGERVKKLFDEASSLGVSIMMLAGGEPLLAPDYLEAAQLHPELLFLLFTNGTLLDSDALAYFERNRHVLPMLSLEGRQAHTDERRGEGVYQSVLNAMTMLKGACIPFGVSVTASSENFEEIIDMSLADELIALGSKALLYVEYVPADGDSGELTLTLDQRHLLVAHCANVTEEKPIISFAFPGDEEAYGGCLAAGRGFAHIGVDGSLEPCPFAPFSDRNIAGLSLEQALASPLLSAISREHHLLEEGRGGCALWSKADWVKNLKDSLPDQGKNADSTPASLQPHA